MMSPVSHYRQHSYTSTRSDQPPAVGTAPAPKLSSSTNLLSSNDPSQLSAPRISSAYSRTLQTHGSTQSGSIDLDTFDVPCPPAMLMTSTTTTLAPPRADDYGAKRKSSCSSAVSSNLPDLGVVDLSDGKNKERPQRFKAVIHFKRKDHPGKKGHGMENASTTATAATSGGFRRSSDYNDESP